jgi:hypothetical protein
VESSRGAVSPRGSLSFVPYEPCQFGKRAPHCLDCALQLPRRHRGQTIHQTFHLNGCIKTRSHHPSELFGWRTKDFPGIEDSKRSKAFDQSNFDLPYPGKIEFGRGGGAGQFHRELTRRLSDDLTGERL